MRDSTNNRLWRGELIPPPPPPPSFSLQNLLSPKLKTWIGENLSKRWIIQSIFDFFSSPRQLRATRAQNKQTQKMNKQCRRGSKENVIICEKYGYLMLPFKNKQRFLCGHWSQLFQYFQLKKNILCVRAAPSPHRVPLLLRSVSELLHCQYFHRVTNVSPA